MPYMSKVICTIFLTFLFISCSSFARDNSLNHEVVTPENSIAEVEPSTSDIFSELNNSKPLELAYNSCGFKPLPPFGCVNGNAVCECRGNTCGWVWHCP